MNKNKKKAPPKATQSFQQLVSQSNRDALKPYIIETCETLVNSLGNQLAANQFQKMASVFTRMTAIQRILTAKCGISEAEVREMVMDVEDEATGHTKTTEAAVEGDLVRITMMTKTSKETEFKRKVQREVTLDLNAENADTKLLNESLVGMKAGETKEVAVGTVKVLLEVNRVSKSPAPEETKTATVQV